MKKIQFIIIPTILSFGLIISSALISNAMNKANKDENRITVKGVAERRIKADKALITFRFLIYCSSTHQYFHFYQKLQ